MRAVLCKAYGPPESLVIEDVPDPKAGAGEVVLRVKAAAVNFPDVLMIEGKYQNRPPMPFSPGGEVAGEIAEVGEGVSQWKPGDRVLASCGYGGYAEAIALSGAAAVAVPDGMEFTDAAAFMMTYATSYHALKDRAEIREGETLLVLGAAGGVGLAAVELGKVMGARVIAAASSQEKCDLCKKYGADETLVYPTGLLEREQQKELSNQIKALTNGDGADVVYDPVGGDYSEPALRATNWGGRFLVIGFAAGSIPHIPLNLALLKSCQIVGVFWGSFSMRYPEENRKNVEALVKLFQSGKIRPHVSKTYRLHEAAEALKDMSARRVLGKIVLVP